MITKKERKAAAAVRRAKMEQKKMKITEARRAAAPGAAARRRARDLKGRPKEKEFFGRYYRSQGFVQVPKHSRTSGTAVSAYVRKY